MPPYVLSDWIARTNGYRDISRVVGGGPPQATSKGAPEETRD